MPIYLFLNFQKTQYTQLSIIRDNGGDGNRGQSTTRLRQILLKILY
jgi:hypothetical protein